MRTFDLVVCGGGPAGHAAIRSYRESGGTGTVLLATSEDRLPYARPPLSKEYLRGEMTAAGLPLEDDAWYAAREIVVALGTPVRGLDPAGKRLLLGAEPIGFGTVLLATGASPAALPVPGGDDPAILRLRTPADSDRIRAAGARGSVTVIGSGFIGCEVAASLALTGTRVRIVGEEALPQQGLLGDDTGKRIAGWLAAAGVDLVLGSGVERVSDGRRIVLANGEELEADTVVTGAGITPNTALARVAGIALERDRVPCDAAMRSEAPGVLVAGDAAFARNDRAGRRLVVQHWGEAERMGEVAGRTAAGRTDAWEQAPGFWSTIGEHTLKHVAWGDGHDETRLLEGEVDDAFAVLYGRAGTLVGVLTSELDDVYELGRALVESGASMDAARERLDEAARTGSAAS
ncbi:MAG: 3-phenylpropionate/trans-cinnamate dioxygenase ferredoxin reductase component [Gaiellaceae bacterium]|nr:3-phenylpropionate/trans-cinnamate dioxygenase ferredoxin reductase component [Gaiellaceae bacterium]